MHCDSLVILVRDNNNFAPSLFLSSCEIRDDCFGPRYFSVGAQLPQKNTKDQYNHQSCFFNMYMTRMLSYSVKASSL